MVTHVMYLEYTLKILGPIEFDLILQDEFSSREKNLICSLVPQE